MTKPRNNIRTYCRIADYYATLGNVRKPSLTDFDILNFDQVSDVSVKFMPPFRKEFYQIVFKLNPTNSSVSLNTSKIESNKSLLIFQSPHHVYTWQRNFELKGFVLFFSTEFIENFQSFENEFDFFRLTETNLLEVERTAEINYFLAKMVEVNESESNFKKQILQSLLTAFLYSCKALFEKQKRRIVSQPRNLTVTNQFLQLVNKFYLERRQVEQYAELLGLTTNYLSELIKETTGKTVHRHIVHRVLTEAKNLLFYTDLDVAEISDTLQFDEPTNFGKFFKKYTGATPLQFRKENLPESV
jgi:AraC family transcriptional regulator, transcriptional activator of pobA